MTMRRDGERVKAYMEAWEAAGCPEPTGGLSRALENYRGGRTMSIPKGARCRVVPVTPIGLLSEADARAYELFCDVAPLPCVNALEHREMYKTANVSLSNPKVKDADDD